MPAPSEETCQDSVHGAQLFIEFWELQILDIRGFFVVVFFFNMYFANISPQSVAYFAFFKHYLWGIEILNFGEV